MTVVWLNGTVGTGKTIVGLALARILPGAAFLDGDDHAGPRHLPAAARWRHAVLLLSRTVARRRRAATLVIAYPLEPAGHALLRAACARARRRFLVVTLAPPLPVTLRGRGGRRLSVAERCRVRAMRSEGYHRRRFASLTLPNALPPPVRTARLIARRLGLTRSAAAAAGPTRSRSPPRSPGSAG